LLKNGLSLWISDKPDARFNEPGLLLLIEHFPLPDEPSIRAFSGYTLLSMIRIVTEEGFPEVPEIGANTRQALEAFGALIGPPKTATVLYRVRTTFAEEKRDYSITTIGYPIAIWQE
jgi:hypothetical protein